MSRQMTEFEWDLLGSKPLYVMDFAKGGFGDILLKPNTPELKSFYEAMPEDERQKHLTDRIKQKTEREARIKVKKEASERYREKIRRRNESIESRIKRERGES